MLTKDLLRVSRAGGGYHPQFAGADEGRLAARVVGVFQGHVGESRAALEGALSDLESEYDFKLVRGFAALLEREATFETRAPLPPERARRTAFEAAEAVGVVTADEREAALDRAADRLGVGADAVAESLYADREDRQVLAEFDPRWAPEELVEQYNLSLAQTALFDATEVRVRSSDPRAAVSAVKRYGLMYEIRREGSGRAGESDRVVVVTGPDALFRRTRRYGTAFARLLRAVATASTWTLLATVDDRGTERELVLTESDVSVPNVDPVAEPSYDSGVEADFAARFSALDLDWELVREPEPLATGARVMIPDFAFDYRPAGGARGEHTPFRVFFEIMGFWTPEYVEKKLSQLADVEDVELLVAVDESLGVPERSSADRSESDAPGDVRESSDPRADRNAKRSGDVAEAVSSRDHRVVTYAGSVQVKDVVDVLREYETDLLEAAAASLPDELEPDADVVSLAELAAERGVSEDALQGIDFPGHERVGRTLVRPSVLSALADEIAPGMSLSEAESALGSRGVDDASAALSALGYRVEWEGLGGGTVRRKDESAE